MTKIKIIVTLLLLITTQSCKMVNVYNTAPVMEKCFYINPDKNISNMGRVAIVVPKNNTEYPQISADVATAFYQQLQKKQILGLNLIAKNDSAWQTLQVSQTGPYTPPQLKDIRDALSCNAIIVGDVTQYSPYPHLTLGLRLKMIDLTDGQLIWAFEQIFDAQDKDTMKKAEKYYKYQKADTDSKLGPKLMSVSSIEFLKFVSYQIAMTL